MQIRAIKPIPIEDLPYDYDPDKEEYAKAFGLKRSAKTLYHPNACKTLVDRVELSNGKTITYAKTLNKWGNTTEKLSYLRDEAGAWVKSKLQYFGKDGEVIKTLKGRKNDTV